jgi:hypothetical protein
MDKMCGDVSKNNIIVVSVMVIIMDMRSQWPEALNVNNETGGFIVYIIIVPENVIAALYCA